MGRGQELTDEQIDLIKAYKDEGKSVRYIAEKIGKSKTATHKYLSAMNPSFRNGSEASPRELLVFSNQMRNVKIINTNSELKLNQLAGKMAKRKHRRSCCVPQCGTTSDGFHLSFHEFPSDSSRRSQWLKNIRLHASEFVLTDWTQRVCGLHFTHNCFKNSASRRVFLYRDAIPTIFPSTIKNTDPATLKLPVVQPALTNPSHCGTPTPPKFQETVFENSATKPSPFPERTLFKGDSETSPNNAAIAEKLGQERPIHDKQTLVHLRKKARCLQDDILRLKQKHTLSMQLVKVENEAKEGSESALLLLEQIQAFNTTHHCWSQRMLRKCIRWRASTGYSIHDAVQKEILSLPCKTTLWRYRSCVKFDD